MQAAHENVKRLTFVVLSDLENVTESIGDSVGHGIDGLVDALSESNRRRVRAWSV